MLAFIVESKDRLYRLIDWHCLLMKKHGHMTCVLEREAVQAVTQLNNSLYTHITERRQIHTQKQKPLTKAVAGRAQACNKPCS